VEASRYHQLLALHSRSPSWLWSIGSNGVVEPGLGRVFQERTGHRLGYTLLGIVFGETLRLQFSTWPAVCDRTHRLDILTTPSESDLR
jgi:hypothetical protein